MNFENLPEKKEYFFKEVTSITGVKPYVLRFWESEFVQISPKVDGSGRKLYSIHDVEVVGRIKNLLFENKLSIPEAKARLDSSQNNQIDEQAPVVINLEKQEYTGVETRESLGSLMKQQSTQLVDLKTSLKEDLEEHKSAIMKKQFNDQDVLNLVKTKKKLSSVLAKIDEIIIAHEWM